MNQDFRLNIGFFSHPKTRRLRRRHGDTAVLCLLQLWAFATQHRYKGVLHDMDADDIVDVSGWHGDTEFVRSLVEFGFLDQGDWYELHDWREHNGWAYFADKRQETARQAAEVRWKKRFNNPGESNG